MSDSVKENEVTASAADQSANAPDPAVEQAEQQAEQQPAPPPVAETPPAEQQQQADQPQANQTQADHAADVADTAAENAAMDQAEVVAEARESFYDRMRDAGRRFWQHLGFEEPPDEPPEKFALLQSGEAIMHRSLDGMLHVQGPLSTSVESFHPEEIVDATDRWLANAKRVSHNVEMARRGM